MNKTTKLTVLGIAILAAMIGAITVPSMFTRGEISVMAQLVIEPTNKIAEHADLIIIGTVTEQHVERTNSDDYPLVNIATVHVKELLKNDPSMKTIEVRSFGKGEAVIDGIRYDVTTSGSSNDFPVGKELVLFLDYDGGNVLGDGYYVVGGYQGVFTIEDGMARNADSNRDVSLTELRSIIESRKE